MSFAQGAAAGERIAAGWLDAYETADTKRREKLAEEEIAKISQTGLVPDYRTMPAGAPTRAQDYAPQSNAPSGLGTGTYDPDVTNVPGMRSSVMGLQDRAPQAPRSTTVNVPMSERVGQEASIYAKYGLTKQAATARDRAYTVGREEKADTRQAKQDANLEEERGIRVGELKRQVAENEGTRAGIAALSADLAAGTVIDLPKIYQYAANLKGDPTKLTAFVGDALKIDKSVADARVEKMSREVKEASSSPDKLNAYIAKTADPDPNDNLIPELRQVKGGWGIFYGKDLLKGTQLYADTKAVPGFQALAMDMIAKAKGDPLGWTIQKLAIDKELAAINASNAAAGASASTSGLNTIRGKQIEAQTKILNANFEGNEEARKIQKQLAELDFENDPLAAQKQANLLNQINTLNVAPGKTVPVGGAKGGGLLKQAVDTKKNDDGTYTAYKKDTGEAIYNTYNGEKIPLGMEIDEYKAMKDAAKKNGVELYRVEDNGALGLAFVGPDGQPYKDPEKAKYSKPVPVEKASPAGEKVGLATTPKAAAPTPPTEKPVREANESFSAFRDRTVAWDKNRMAYEQLLSDQRVREMLSGNASGLQLNNRPMVR